MEGAYTSHVCNTVRKSRVTDSIKSSKKTLQSQATQFSFFGGHAFGLAVTVPRLVYAIVSGR